MAVIDFSQTSLQNRAQDAARQLSNKRAQLLLEESHLASVSRELVSALGALKKAEAAQKKSCNSAVDTRVEKLKTEVATLRKAEDVSTRIVTAAKTLIDDFLGEGAPSNRELIDAAREYELAMQL